TPVHFYFSPLKVFEYLAAGLPVVASSIGQIARIIQHDINGLLYPPGDSAALATVLEQLRDDPEFCLRLGPEAGKTILRNHTWDQVVRLILKASIPGSGLDAAHERLAVP